MARKAKGSRYGGLARGAGRSLRSNASPRASQLPQPERNTMTGEQLLLLDYRERRYLRRKRVNTARYERRAVKAANRRAREAARKPAKDRGYGYPPPLVDADA